MTRVQSREYGRQQIAEAAVHWKARQTKVLVVFPVSWRHNVGRTSAWLADRQILAQNTWRTLDGRWISEL